MRRKKHKHTRRALRFYRITHGFRPPYKVRVFCCCSSAGWGSGWMAVISQHCRRAAEVPSLSCCCTAAQPQLSIARPPYALLLEPGSSSRSWNNEHCHGRCWVATLCLLPHLHCTTPRLFLSLLLG